MSSDLVQFGPGVAIEGSADRLATWLAVFTKTFRHLLILMSLVVTMGVAHAQSQYAGTYAGTYSGDESGTWQGVADSSGHITGY